MDLDLAVHDRVGNRLVIDQILHCFCDLGVCQSFVFLVQTHVVDRALNAVFDLDVGVVGQRDDLFSAKVAGDVDVALFQQQTLRRTLRDMTVDRAHHLRGIAAEVVVAFQHDDFVRTPITDRERARSGIVCLQPFIAKIAIDLVAYNQLLIDNETNRRGQAIQQQRGGIGLVHLKLERHVAGLADHLFDVVGGQAELGQDKGRGFVQLDSSLQRIHRISGSNRVARGELQVRLDDKAKGFAVL